MRASIEKHAAKMRLRNTEYLRQVLLRRIERMRNEGVLNDAEAAQLKREFWNERFEDKKLLDRRAERKQRLTRKGLLEMMHRSLKVLQGGRRG